MAENIVQEYGGHKIKAVEKRAYGVMGVTNQVHLEFCVHSVWEPHRAVLRGSLLEQYLGDQIWVVVCKAKTLTPCFQSSPWIWFWFVFNPKNVLCDWDAQSAGSAGKGRSDLSADTHIHIYSNTYAQSYTQIY